MNVVNYIGIPYENRGRSIQGCDCYGLVWLFYLSELDIELKILDGYELAEEAQDYLRENRHVEWKRIEEPKLHCTVLIKFKGSNSHIGIYLGNGKMLHSMKGQNSSVEDIRTSKWKHRIEGYYEYVSSCN